MNKNDNRWMEQALALARKGVGLTRPNPPVGAVVVKGNRRVAEGWHKRAGALHAERMALLNAKTRAQKATLYVTLEPCSTWGRTPPCTDIILESGIQRVVVAAVDPNPVHAGKGLRMLKDNGIEVVSGVCADAGEDLIKAFSSWIMAKRPYITLKLAMSADGKIADRNGHSKWITGPVAREFVQQKRREVDAVMVGAQTVIKDNPSLLPRPACKRKPYRIILDSSGRIPLTRKVFTDSHVRQTIYVTTNQCSNRRLAELAKKNVQVWVTPVVKGRVSLKAVMKKAHALNIMHMMCEGGGELAAGLIQQQLVDEYLLFHAPCIIGGHNSSDSVAGKGWLMGQLPALHFDACETMGRDILIRAKSG